MFEAVLVDGSRLCFDASRTFIRSSVSRAVRDISWAPTWWVLDYLAKEKLGGLVPSSLEWERYQQMLDERSHKPFGTLRAPVDPAHLVELLSKQLGAAGPVSVDVGDDGSHRIHACDSDGCKRHRFTVRIAEANWPAELSEVVLHDCASRVNAAAVVALATALTSWKNGQAPGNRWMVHAINSDQLEVSGRLAYDAGEARRITEHLHVQDVDLNAQGGMWITSAVLPPDLIRRSRFVINF